MEFPRYMAPIPGSGPTVSSSFTEPHRPSAQGTTFRDPISPLRDGQAPRSHFSIGKSSEEGSKFVAEKLIPLHPFSPEKLVPRYPMDSSAPSPQEQLQTKKFPGPPTNYTKREPQRGQPTPHSSNPNVEFMARQSANARSRPLHWQTQCPRTMNPLGDPAGGCHYGPSCIYGHDGDVYKDNLSVYYTFENDRPCPNFISPATPGPLFGVQGLCPPAWVVPQANPQAQTLHAGQSNQALSEPRTTHLHHASGHRDMEVGAPMVQPAFPRLHASQPASLGSGQPASSEEPFVVDESLFRREPLISMADYIAHCNNNGVQPLSVGEIAAVMEAQYMMECGGASDNVQPD